MQTSLGHAYANNFKIAPVSMDGFWFELLYTTTFTP